MSESPSTPAATATANIDGLAPGEYPLPDWPERLEVSRLIFDGRAVRVGDDKFRVLPADEVAAQRVRASEQREQRRAERQAQEREQRRAEHLRRCQSLWEASNVPPRFRTADLAGLGNVPQAYRTAAASLQALLDSPALVALVGPRGGGKTFLACGLIREFCRRGRTARYLRTLDFFREVRGTWNNRRGEADEADIVDRLARMDLLILDEAQDRSGSQWEAAQLTNLVDRRYADLRPTLLLGNLTPQDLAGSVGESAASRLTDGGRIVTANWPSLRGGPLPAMPDLMEGEWTPVAAGAIPNQRGGVGVHAFQ